VAVEFSPESSSSPSLFKIGKYDIVIMPMFVQWGQAKGEKSSEELRKERIEARVKEIEAEREVKESKPKTPEQPRVTIRRKKYRGEDGYLVAGIFVKERATAEEIKSAYKRGASPDEISDIVMGQKHVSESVRSEYYANRKLLQERRAAKQESLKAELATPVRSDHALAVDRAFDAKNTVDASDAAGRAAWSKNPGRMDMRGQDTKADRPRRPSMGR
jgi:hypothetical protein